VKFLLYYFSILRKYPIEQKLVETIGLPPYRAAAAVPHRGCNYTTTRPVRLAYQPPASSTFLSQQTSHQQPASTTLLSEQTSTSHQPPANRTG
jgi:hypothetical protein